MRWVIPTVNQHAADKLERELSIPPLVARLLVLRGITEPEQAHRFLNPRLSDLHDPFLMADMNVAVDRVRRAIERQERILIYGDYDVDGTMAVIVLLTVLKALGAKVEAHIPHRMTDGYGMRVPVVERAAAEGCGLAVSVDTGIREHEVIARARELGVDCIVTDHHLPDRSLPAACAILNPHRPGCPYPNKNLSGVGVAFKLAQALLGTSPAGPSERLIRSYLKVVAIGTIADVVPLMGENRVIARYGLEGLSEPGAVGLGSLLAVSRLQGCAVTTGGVGFRLAPRINAAGRMESARDVIELFTTSQPEKAREIAERLDKLNTERQEVEERILNEIIERVEAPSLEARELRLEGWQAPSPKPLASSLVFAGEGWHRGVIGIVAQRLVDRYYRPTLVIAVENGVGYGSGRSIAGFHLLNALTEAGDLFHRFGGHAQAAGFTIPAHRIPALEARLEAHARSVLRPDDLEPRLRLDGEISLAELNRRLYKDLEKLEPHGLGNPTPVFAARNLRLLEPPRVLKEKHLRIRVAQGASRYDALGWGLAEQAAALFNGCEVDLAFTLEENVYQELTSLQLILRDVRRAEGRSQ